MVVAPLDRLANGQLASAAFERALEPKKLALIPGGHFDPDAGPSFEPASQAAREWFTEPLLTKNG
jgi:uncharacterized protein